MKESLFLLALILVAVVSCDKSKYSASKNLVLPIDRFEVELFSADPATLEQHINTWKEKYGVFFSHFCRVTGLGNDSDPAFAGRLRDFVSDRGNYMLYRRTMEIFPDLDATRAELEVAYSNYALHFPDKTIPRICTFISALSQSAITDDSLLAIGLDRYLGVDEPVYRVAGIYNYLTENMYPARIPADCMRFWAETEFPFNDSVNNLIASMIYQGRILYFTRSLMPGKPDSLTLGFSSAEIDYLEKNENSMWAFLIEQKLLFNTDRFTINKFILEGPFTTDFGGTPRQGQLFGLVTG